MDACTRFNHLNVIKCNIKIYILSNMPTVSKLSRQQVIQIFGDCGRIYPSIVTKAWRLNRLNVILTKENKTAYYF